MLEGYYIFPSVENVFKINYLKIKAMNALSIQISFRCNFLSTFILMNFLISNKEGFCVGHVLSLISRISDV